MLKLSLLSAACLVLSVVSAAQAASQEASGRDAPLSLPELLREALQHNPEIRSAQRAAEARRARIPQAGALPDPVLAAGVTNEGRPVPFQTLGAKDFSEIYVGLTQDFPYPGKRRLRAAVAREEAAAAEWSHEATRRRVVSAVAETYYDLYEAHAALDTVDASARLLETLTRLAHTKLAVGQTSQHDVLEAEVELSRLEELRSQFAERRAILEARLASLLDRPAAEPLAAPGPLTPSPLSGTLDDALRLAEERSPLLRVQARSVTQAERGVDLARRERLPDFGVSVTYHHRGRLDAYYTLGGTLTLPNLHGRQAKAIEEAVAALGGARSTYDQIRAEVRYQVNEAYQMAATAERLMRLYDEGIRTQARLALDSALAQYRVGKVDFLALITSWRHLLDYDLAWHTQLAVHEKALARLAVHLERPAAPAQ